jgi:hypothetical protein
MQATLTKQTELIDLHKRMKGEQETCENSGLYAHYEYLLFSLRKIIESHGPTPEYYEWTNSISST